MIYYPKNSFAVTQLYYRFIKKEVQELWSVCCVRFLNPDETEL